MGLQVTHGAYTGSCTRFNQWRSQVADRVGFDLANTEEIPGESEETPPDRTDPVYIALAAIGHWKQNPANIMEVLLMHYDDDGEIRPEQAAPLADALEALAADAEPDDNPGSFYRTTMEFVKGLREAVALEETMYFQ